MKLSKRTIVDVALVFFTALFYLLNNLVFKKTTTGILRLFFICYFNDLICPLLFVAYVNLLLNPLKKRLSKIWQIIVLCFLCGLVWEFVAPLLKKGSVTDIFDLFCYCIGGILY